MRQFDVVVLGGEIVVVGLCYISNRHTAGGVGKSALTGISWARALSCG